MHPAWLCTLLVFTLNPPPCDAVPKVITEQRRLLDDNRHWSPWIWSKLNRLAHSLEKTSHMNSTSSRDIKYLEVTGDVQSAARLEKQRSLRASVVETLTRDVEALTATLERLVSSVSTESIAETIRQRLHYVQKSSLEIEDHAQLSGSLHEEERREWNSRQDTTPTTSTSALDKLVSGVDKDLAASVEVIEKQSKSLNNDDYQKAKEATDATVQTVIKMAPESDGKVQNSDDSGVVSHLIDHDGNQYVLSQPRDSFLHYEDIFLTTDISLLIFCCFGCGYVTKLLRLPAFFGYIISGTLLSPSIANQLRSIVQVETLAQFGVYFLLFSLGCEFSLQKLRKVMRPAIIGGLMYILLVVVAVVVCLYYIFRAPVSEAILVGFCVSLSSTVVTLGMMNAQETASMYGQLIIAVLVMQDVCLGLMLATIPILSSATLQIETYFTILLNLCAALAMTYILSVHITPHLLAATYQDRELFLLAICSLCFASMLATEKMGLSMEIGCFLTGLTVSSQGEGESASGKLLHYPHRVETLLMPLKDFFGALFFASIGIHISPAFLRDEWLMLAVVVGLVMLVKLVIGALVFRCFNMEKHEALLVGAGLSQMSEFSFVVAAHGKAQGLINREVYFMLLGITSLSLLLSPFLWKLCPRPTTSPKAVSVCSSHSLSLSLPDTDC